MAGKSPYPGQFRWNSFPWRYWVWAFVLFLLALYWAGSAGQSAVHQLSYTEFKAAVRADQVESVVLWRQEIRGQFTKDAPQASKGKAASRTFETTRPPVEDPQLMSLLEQHDVSISAESTRASWWQRLLVNFLPWVLILGLIIYLSYRMQQRMAAGGQSLFGYGKSKAKRFRQAETGVTMDDVAGDENAKRDLQEIVDYLRNPRRYLELGAEIPKGVLLMGPPGTGKTLLARAVAGTADVPFYSISGSEFIEMFVGVGASRVRDMFNNAKEESPAIIFIDELDSIGRSRGTGLGGGHDEREQTLNQILSEMDGFSKNESVIVIAATNRPDVLDPALLRPGRFDRKVTLELPHRSARREILEIHARNKPLADEVDLAQLARRTVGFSGADLENLLNEAALLAGRQGLQAIDDDCLTQARDRLVLGGKREGVLEDAEKEVIAYHECGHALLAYLLPNADPLDRVTVIPRGRALGATEQQANEDRYNMRESYLRERIAVMLGGRVAEQMVYGEVTTGSQQDLRQATDLARRMVSEWGMSRELGAASFPRGESHPFLGREMAQQQAFSERTAELVDEETRTVLGQAEQLARDTLETHRDRLDAIVARLLDEETLSAEQVDALMKSDGSGASRNAQP